MSIVTREQMLDEHLSQERLARYRKAAGGDEVAIEAYKWNVAISGALLELISHVEVPLRNALACELERLATQAADGSAWWEHRDWFEARSLADIDRAIENVRGRGRELTHGRLVAELNLGFWRYLLDKRHDRTLWRTALHRAFPNLAGPRSDVYEVVAMMNEVRNRIAHHEAVFHRDHIQLEQRLLRLLDWICYDYRAWAAAESRVQSIVARRPAGMRHGPP